LLLDRESGRSPKFAGRIQLSGKDDTKPLFF
jgi:hypothetical protein